MQLFVEMGMDSNKIYEQDFEVHFLEETAKFYKRASAVWLNENGGNFTYLRRCVALVTAGNVKEQCAMRHGGMGPAALVSVAAGLSSFWFFALTLYFQS